MPPPGKDGDVSIMLGIGKKKPGAGMKDMESGLDSTAKEEAGQALADAIAAGDGAGIAAAFQDMYDLCAEPAEMPEEEPEEALDDLEM
jgi:hypothetical protein